MIQHCPVLIVLLPLTAALLCLLFSKFNKNLGSWLVIGSIAGSLACSLQVLHQTLTSGEAIHYWMGNWEPPLGIEFVIDPLSAVMAVLITFISLMVAVYSKPFMRKEDWLHIGGYYTLYGLLTVGLCGMVITGDMFNLYVYLEVMSLSGYGLIAMGGKKIHAGSFSLYADRYDRRFPVSDFCCLSVCDDRYFEYGGSGRKDHALSQFAAVRFSGCMSVYRFRY